MTSQNDLILRKDALQVLSDEIDLARVAFPQVIPILAADMRAIAATPASFRPDHPAIAYAMRCRRHFGRTSALSRM